MMPASHQGHDERRGRPRLRQASSTPALVPRPPVVAYDAMSESEQACRASMNDMLRDAGLPCPSPPLFQLHDFATNFPSFDSPERRRLGSDASQIDAIDGRLGAFGFEDAPGGEDEVDGGAGPLMDDEEAADEVQQPADQEEEEASEPEESGGEGDDDASWAPKRFSFLTSTTVEGRRVLSTRRKASLLYSQSQTALDEPIDGTTVAASAGVDAPAGSLSVDGHGAADRRRRRSARHSLPPLQHLSPTRRLKRQFGTGEDSGSESDTAGGHGTPAEDRRSSHGHAASSPADTGTGFSSPMRSRTSLVPLPQQTQQRVQPPSRTPSFSNTLSPNTLSTSSSSTESARWSGASFAIDSTPPLMYSPGLSPMTSVETAAFPFAPSSPPQTVDSPMTPPAATFSPGVVPAKAPAGQWRASMFSQSMPSLVMPAVAPIAGRTKRLSFSLAPTSESMYAPHSPRGIDVFLPISQSTSDLLRVDQEGVKKGMLPQLLHRRATAVTTAATPLSSSLTNSTMSLPVEVIRGRQKERPAVLRRKSLVAAERQRPTMTDGAVRDPASKPPRPKKPPKSGSSSFFRSLSQSRKKASPVVETPTPESPIVTSTLTHEPTEILPPGTPKVAYSPPALGNDAAGYFHPSQHVVRPRRVSPRSESWWKLQDLERGVASEYDEEQHQRRKSCGAEMEGGAAAAELEDDVGSVDSLRVTGTRDKRWTTLVALRVVNADPRPSTPSTVHTLDQLSPNRQVGVAM